MKNPIFCLLLAVILALFAAPAFAQDDASDANTGSFDQDIVRFFEVSRLTDTYKAVLPQLFAQFRAVNDKVPANVWDELEKEMANSVTEIQDLLVPVYKKHFTQADIRALTAFYETPTGRKFAEKQGALYQDATQVGQTWGQAVGQKVADRLKARGY
jgi:uncharacterized protein